MKSRNLFKSLVISWKNPRTSAKPISIGKKGGSRCMMFDTMLTVASLTRMASLITCQLPGFTELPDKKTISQEYIPAIENMLQKQLDDVGTVFVFDWRVRRTKHNRDSSLTTSIQIRASNTETKAGSKINFGDQSQPLLPSNYAHIDTCPISVIRRIQESFPDDAERILRQRVRAVKYVIPLSFL